MNMIKIGIFGVAGVLLALQFKSQKAEYGIYIGLAICLIIFGFCLDGLAGLLQSIGALAEEIQGSQEYMKYLIKALGVTYVCNFSSLICKDAGYLAVAGQIEVFGKLSVLLMGLPVLVTVVQGIGALHVG